VPLVGKKRGRGHDNDPLVATGTGDELKLELEMNIKMKMKMEMEPVQNLMSREKAQEWPKSRKKAQESMQSLCGTGLSTNVLKRRLTTFFTQCPQAWNKVLEVKRTSTNAEARRSTAQPKPSGAPSKPLATPIKD
jgi:hypothetical protein